MGAHCCCCRGAVMGCRQWCSCSQLVLSCCGCRGLTSSNGFCQHLALSIHLALSTCVVTLAASTCLPAQDLPSGLTEDQAMSPACESLVADMTLLLQKLTGLSRLGDAGEQEARQTCSVWSAQLTTALMQIWTLSFSSVPHTLLPDSCIRCLLVCRMRRCLGAPPTTWSRSTRWCWP